MAPAPMEHPLVKVTLGSHDASQEAKGMEAMSQRRQLYRINHEWYYARISQCGHAKSGGKLPRNLIVSGCQGVWLGRLDGDLMDRDSEVVLNVDSESTTFLREDPVHHERSIHIDTMYQFIKHCVEQDKVEVNYICTND